MEDTVRKCVTEGLIGEAVRLARARGKVGLAMLYVDSDSIRLLRGVCEVRVAFMSAEASLDHLDGGYQAVIERSSSALRRKYARERKRFLSRGFSAQTESLTAVMEEVLPLLENVERRHGKSTPASLLGRVLKRELTGLLEPAQVLTYRDGSDRMLACCVLYPWRECLYSRAVGLDYERLGDSFGYFNILLYDAADLASDQGRTRLMLGLATPVKVERGASLRPLYGAFVDLAAHPGKSVEVTDQVRIANPADWLEWVRPFEGYDAVQRIAPGFDLSEMPPDSGVQNGTT